MRNTERTSLLVTDATLGSAEGPSSIPVDGRAALLNLSLVLRHYGLDVDLVTDESGTAHTLTICHPDPVTLAERPPKGRPRKGERWPEGLDSDAERLEWLETTPAADACETLGISKRTLYRRIDALRASV